MKKTEVFLSNLTELYEKRDLLNKLIENKKLIENYSISEIHCIDSIGKIKDPNVTKLAISLNMTKGAISKITKKLNAQKIITKYTKADNKKEFYFKLTKDGKKVYTKHELLHNKSKEKYIDILNKFDDNEKDVIIKFLEIIVEHLENEIKEVNINEN
ncbi:MAG TPA: MarR family transcriptional regulator [Tissierellales bacterium]|nr:MarR family transcriptional regulator [Tissierellales bacterium]